MDVTAAVADDGDVIIAATATVGVAVAAVVAVIKFNGVMGVGLAETDDAEVGCAPKGGRAGESGGLLLVLPVAALEEGAV